MKIAVWTDASGQCASLIGAAQVRLYQPSAQRPDDWQLDQMLAVSLDEQGGLAVMRGQLEQVLGWMRQHECEDLVVSELQGFARSIIDGFGVAMWRLQGPMATCLAAIRTFREQKHQQARAQADNPPVSLAEHRCRQQKGLSVTVDQTELARYLPQPVEEGKAGCYTLNLVDSLAQTGLNSQQLLLPLLQTAAFSEVLVQCEHPPRWLMRQQSNLGVEVVEVSREGESVQLLVRRGG